MCGIVGIYNHGSRGPIDPRELTTIRDHMARRGPDGAGNWFSDDGRIGLGHRRLAIIGPGEQGAQPMALDGCQRPSGHRTVVTFNGEIYNHAELRTRLLAKGHVFHSSCDTEVLLHLYEDVGIRLVDHLRGMYAFGIWDTARERLLLARDPFGVKPLYYANDGSTFRFASQARALLAGGLVPSTIDEGALAGFFVLGSVPEPRSAWTAIRSVPAGSTMVLDPGRAPLVTNFFSVAGVLSKARRQGCDQDFADAVADSVRAHLVADVEVGTFLSAGIDSGAILGLASEASGSVKAVTLGFAEFRETAADETGLAALVADRYGAKHSVEVISATEYETSLPAFFADMDQPTIDGLNTWFVSRAAHGTGLKVVLSGLGGDELTGGYSTFRSVPILHRRLRLAAAIPGLGRAARAALRAALPSWTNPKLPSVLEYAAPLELAWLLRRSVFLPWELASVMGADRAIAALEDLQLETSVLHSAINPDPGTDVSRVAALECSLYMRNQLLRDTDWASMAHSVEVRVPLIDKPLYCWAASRFRARLPGAAKSPLATAPILPLPPEIIGRAKSGFGLPMQAWVAAGKRTPWRGVPGLSHRHCPWSRRWAYVVADEFGLLGSR